MKELSVLLPCYNAGPYLLDTLHSINSQTYFSFELIFVNDGSTDNSLNLFESFEWREDIVTTIINQENKGFLNSILSGLRECNGDIIARCDADDVWHDRHLQRGVDVLKEDDNLVLVGSRARFIDENSIVSGLSKIIINPRRYLLRDNPFIHSSVLFKRKAYDITCHGYNSDIPLKEHIADYLLFVRLAGVGDIKIFNTPSLDYRILSNSMSRKFENVDILKARLMCIRLGFETASFSNRLYGIVWVILIHLRIYVESIISFWRK